MRNRTRPDFPSYFAVRSFDRGARTVYTQRASAQWQFDGSGGLVGGTWNLTGKGNSSADPKFKEETGGDVVPVTTEPVYNDLLATEGWNLVDMP